MDDAEERYTNPMTKPPDEYILSESEDPAWSAEGKHRSETGITLPVDFTINNDGSLEDLWWEVDRIMRSLA